MNNHHLCVKVIWSDTYLLEIETELVFQRWAGAEVAYVTREELLIFANDLDTFAAGHIIAASLTAGQRDLSFAELSAYEHGLARSAALDVHLGRAPGVSGPGDRAAALHVCVPIERGQLNAFAAALRLIVQAERGDAILPVPVDW